MSNYYGDWAKYYGLIGFRVTPITPGQKSPPLLKNWPEKATADAATIAALWEKTPNANIALATGGGIFDIETDIKGGINGEDSLTRENFTLPETVSFTSGGGGIHRLYKYAGDLPNRVGLLPNVDFRGGGGYCVLPPSLHPNGKPYTWLPSHAPNEIEIADLPPELAMMFVEKGNAAHLEVPETIPEGQRNDTLFREACRLREFGHSENEIRSLIYTMNTERDAGLDDTELDKLISQAVKYPRGKLPERTRPPVLVKASAIPYEPPRWLIAPYFQRGKGNLIQADNGTGKTAFVCAVAAHVSTGSPLLDIPISAPGNVLILSVEDDLPILRGRIEANGGDLDKCHFMTNAAGLTFNSPEIEQAVQALTAKMLVFDPFQAFLGGKVDMHKANETRPELAKLFDMADRNDCAVVILAHMGKDNALKSAVNRSLGSIDIPAAMRSIIQLVRNPEDEEECIAVHVKCSNAPKGRSLSFNIGDRGGVQWNGYSPITVEDLGVLAKRKEKGIPYANEPLVKVFEQLIADRPGGGFWSYEAVRSRGMEILGYAPFTEATELKAMLKAGIARELQTRSGITVTTGHKQNGDRGIRAEQTGAAT
jgi:hypothetical protein